MDPWDRPPHRLRFKAPVAVTLPASEAERMRAEISDALDDELAGELRW